MSQECLAAWARSSWWIRSATTSRGAHFDLRGRLSRRGATRSGTGCRRGYRPRCRRPESLPLHEERPPRRSHGATTGRSQQGGGSASRSKPVGMVEDGVDHRLREQVAHVGGEPVRIAWKANRVSVHPDGHRQATLGRTAESWEPALCPGERRAALRTQQSYRTCTPRAREPRPLRVGDQHGQPRLLSGRRCGALRRLEDIGGASGDGDHQRDDTEPLRHRPTVVPLQGRAAQVASVSHKDLAVQPRKQGRTTRLGAGRIEVTSGVGRSASPVSLNTD